MTNIRSYAGTRAGSQQTSKLPQPHLSAEPHSDFQLERNLHGGPRPAPRFCLFAPFCATSVVRSAQRCSDQSRCYFKINTFIYARWNWSGMYFCTTINHQVKGNMCNASYFRLQFSCLQQNSRVNLAHELTMSCFEKQRGCVWSCHTLWCMECNNSETRVHVRRSCKFYMHNNKARVAKKKRRRQGTWSGSAQTHRTLPHSCSACYWRSQICFFLSGPIFYLLTSLPPTGSRNTAQVTCTENQQHYSISLSWIADPFWLNTQIKMRNMLAKPSHILLDEVRTVFAENFSVGPDSTNSKEIPEKSPDTCSQTVIRGLDFIFP